MAPHIVQKLKSPAQYTHPLAYQSCFQRHHKWLNNSSAFLVSSDLQQSSSIEGLQPHHHLHTISTKRCYVWFVITATKFNTNVTSLGPKRGTKICNFLEFLSLFATRIEYKWLYNQTTFPVTIF